MTHKNFCDFSEFYTLDADGELPASSILSSISSDGIFSCVEINPGGGAKIARSAGTSVQISGTSENYSLIKMTSGEIRKIDSRAMATIGANTVGRAEETASF